MSTDTLALALIIAAAPAVSGFPLLYGMTSPWWRSLLGRALMTKSVGLALLIDLGLLFRLFGDYPYREYAVLVVFGLIVLGAWMQLLALIREKCRVWRKSHRG